MEQDAEKQEPCCSGNQIEPGSGLKKVGKIAIVIMVEGRIKSVFLEWWCWVEEGEFDEFH